MNTAVAKKIFKFSPIIAIISALLWLIAGEPFLINFFQEGHLSWVPVHSLAIAKHSWLIHGGLGFSCQIQDENGNIFYDYFNRYSVFFTSKYILLPFERNIAEWIYASKQLMNIIFIANIFVLWRICKELKFSGWIAGAAVFASASSEIVLKYKSMYHFDQPALLAYFICVLVVSRIYGSSLQKSWQLITAVGIGSLIGRATIVMLFPIALMIINGSIGLLLRNKQKSIFVDRAKASAKAAVTGIALTGMALMYNLIFEMRINKIGLSDTSIYQSALRRLGLSLDGFSERAAEKTAWISGGALESIYRSTEKYIAPVIYLAGLLLVVYIILKMVYGGRRLPDSKSVSRNGLSFRDFGNTSDRTVILLSVSLSYILWCILMKNLYIFHDYSGMNAWVVSCIMSAFLLEKFFISISRFSGSSPASQAKKIVFFVSIIIFCAQLSSVRSEVRLSDVQRNKVLEFLKEVDNFNILLADQDLSVARDQSWVPSSPYAQCAFLSKPLQMPQKINTQSDQVLTAPRFTGDE